MSQSHKYESGLYQANTWPHKEFDQVELLSLKHK